MFIAIMWKAFQFYARLHFLMKLIKASCVIIAFGSTKVINKSAVFYHLIIKNDCKQKNLKF